MNRQYTVCPQKQNQLLLAQRQHALIVGTAIQETVASLAMIISSTSLA